MSPAPLRATGGAEGADAVISIRGSTESAERDLTIALAQATRGESARLLKLAFDDIGMERYGHFLGPTMRQVADAIEFGRHVVDGGGFFDGPSAEPPDHVRAKRLALPAIRARASAPSQRAPP